MDMVALHLFVDIIKLGSFSAAAKANFITQPALSRKIADFESKCGFKLLDRNARPIIPTSEGSALYAHAVDLLNRERALDEEFARIREGEGMVLRINHSSAGWVGVFNEGLKRFSEEYPHAQILVERAYNPDAVRNVIDGTVDAIVISLPEVEGIPELEYKTLAALPLCAIVPEDHPFARRESVELGELADQKLVTVVEAGWPAVVGKTRHLCAEAGFEVAFSHETPPIELPLYVELNHEVGLVPMRMIPEHAGLVEVPVEGTGGFDIVLAWRADDARVMVRALRRAFNL